MRKSPRPPPPRDGQRMGPRVDSGHRGVRVQVSGCSRVRWGCRSAAGLHGHPGIQRERFSGSPCIPAAPGLAREPQRGASPGSAHSRSRWPARPARAAFASRALVLTVWAAWPPGWRDGEVVREIPGSRTGIQCRVVGAESGVHLTRAPDAQACIEARTLSRSSRIVGSEQSRLRHSAEAVDGGRHKRSRWPWDASFTRVCVSGVRMSAMASLRSVGNAGGMMTSIPWERLRSRQTVLCMFLFHPLALVACRVAGRSVASGTSVLSWSWAEEGIGYAARG